MNYYLYFVEGIAAREYLQGTNYVGIWADDPFEARKNITKYFAKGTPITEVPQSQVQGSIGYLY
ncbi:hypothetical protein WKH57_01320 [Niallia taxi]|uniref:hypothetical protein n=1 Tax=Niallia taxi TaxID=2499688 RepID=UPI0031718814